MTELSAFGASIQAHFPLVPAPRHGASPAFEALRATAVGHGFVLAETGLWLLVRRPWLTAQVQVAAARPALVPYGPPDRQIHLACGPLPGELLAQVLTRFRAHAPDEDAAFIVWHDQTRAFRLAFPEILARSTQALRYDQPVLEAGESIVADIHSHGFGRAFFSLIDDDDDHGTTKLSIVIGRLDRAVPEMALRLCANGHFEPLECSLFGDGPQLAMRHARRAPEEEVTDDQLNRTGFPGSSALRVVIALSSR